MADRMAVMDNGRVIQVGTPQEIYRDPRTSYVAAFIGETNVVEGTVAGESTKGAITVETKAGPFAGRITDPDWKPGTGERVMVSVRPEAIRVSDATGPSHGKIVETTYLGDVIQYKIQRKSGVTLRVSEMNPRVVRQPGDENLQMSVQPDDVVVLRE